MFPRPHLTHRARLRLVAGLAFVFGALVGVIMHWMPQRTTTRHSFCTLCALHRIETEQEPIVRVRGLPGEEWLVKRASVTRGGVLHRLVAPAVGEHRHAWLDPAPYVAPTNPPKRLEPPADFQQAIASDELSDLDRLEESPHLIALLDEAMRNDHERTLHLVQRILDPQAHVGVDAIALLDRPTRWENRWAVIDAFFDVYRCSGNDVSVSCRMRLGSTDLIVLARTAVSLHAGGIDWAHWVPPGMNAPPGEASPTSFAVVTN